MVDDINKVRDIGYFKDKSRHIRRDSEGNVVLVDIDRTPLTILIDNGRRFVVDDSVPLLQLSRDNLPWSNQVDYKPTTTDIEIRSRRGAYRRHCT